MMTGDAGKSLERLQSMLTDEDKRAMDEYLAKECGHSSGDAGKVFSTQRDPQWQEAMDSLPDITKRDISEGVRLVKRLENAEDDAHLYAIINELSQWARGCGWSHTPDDIMERTIKENEQLRKQLSDLQQRNDSQAKAIADHYKDCKFPHMCRMDHVEIRYARSDDDERCPLCQAVDEISDLQQRVREIEKALPTIPHPGGDLVKVVAHYQDGSTQTIDGDVVAKVANNCRENQP